MGIPAQAAPGALDDLARGASAVHRLDARAKLLVTLVFVVAVVAEGPYALAALTPYLAFPAVVFALSGLPLRPILWRLAAAAPFALCIGAFNPLFDTRPLLAVGEVVLTGGWVSFLSIQLRLLLCVGALLLLVATTGTPALGRAAGALGAPRALVDQILALYRHLHLLAGEAGRLWRAHALRAPQRRRPTAATAGRMLGQLLLRTLRRAGRVHAAMRLRGFDGRMRTLAQPRWTAADTRWLVLWCGWFLAAYTLAPAQRLGEWLGRFT